MVTTGTERIFSVIILMFFGSYLCNAQRLRHIKDFHQDDLKNINTAESYQCVGVYFTDKHYNITQTLRNTTNRILKFRRDGYIESNIIASNNQGYTGVIYSKKGQLKIDLIGGTSDNTKVVRTYHLRIEGHQLHLIEDSAFARELIYYIYELKKNQ